MHSPSRSRNVRIAIRLDDSFPIMRYPLVVERTCPICGIVYPLTAHDLRWDRGKTCSKKCGSKLTGQKLSRQIVLSCAVCGTRFERPPSHVKTKHVFCSRACHYKGRSKGLVKRVVTKPYNLSDGTRQRLADLRRAQNAKRKAEGNYAHSEATKRKLRCTTSKAIAEGRIPRVSGFEKRVGTVLETLGVPHEPQRRFRDKKGRFGAVVDFFLPDQNVALEANGTFWHADPRVFPQGPKHASQKRTCSRYEKKRKFLQDRGIEIVEVWELDFNQDPEKAVRTALGLP